jgi:thiopurine S-methyltransferase
MSIDREFWHQRWRDGNTPWHRDAPNPRLLTHFDRLDLAPGAQVYVPLCGKAEDMRWLLERGLRVLGVELSPIAVHAFFDTHELPVRERRDGAFQVFEAPGVALLCGDVFDLEARHLADVAAVYDHASLVALDAEDRRRFAGQSCTLLPRGARQLVLTLEYDTHSMQGPPFSVPAAEVGGLYAPRFETRHLASLEILDEEPGLRALDEHVLLLTDSRA